MPLCGELGPDALAVLRELVPVGAADRELDREPALGREARLREVLDHGAHPGIAVQLLAERALEIGLRERPLLGRLHRDEQDARVHAAPSAEAPDNGEDPLHRRVRAHGRLGATEEPVGLLDVRADRRLQADKEPPLVLRRDELRREALHGDDRAGEEDRAEQHDRDREPERPGEEPAVAAGERLEAAIDEPPEAARPSRETSRICAQRAGARVIASRYERSTAMQRVTPNWRKNRPTTPSMKMIGEEDRDDRERRGERREGDLAPCPRGRRGRGPSPSRRAGRCSRAP